MSAKSRVDARVGKMKQCRGRGTSCDMAVAPGHKASVRAKNVDCGILVEMPYKNFTRFDQYQRVVPS